MPRRGRVTQRRPRRRVFRVAVLGFVLVALAAGVGGWPPLRAGWPALLREPVTGQSPFAAAVGGSAGPEAGVTTVPPTAPSGAVPPASTSPAATPSPSSPPAPPLQVPGPVPATGSGRFAYATGTGEVFGRAGTLRRYRVAVEEGAQEDAETFAAAVDLALGDARGWTASGRLRLRRVPAGAAHEFTVYLATPGTAGRMCAAGGINIRVGGRPYTSCRATGKVIINLERWRRSVPHLVAARVPLETYRTYVVNHEVGHELGHRHERCPGRRRPAPVMMQQTLFLDGCVPNPWPYLDGRRYTGPSV